MATEQLPEPRKIDPERAKEVRGKRTELMAQIDALLAEYPSTWGPVGMRKQRAV